MLRPFVEKTATLCGKSFQNADSERLPHKMEKIPGPGKVGKDFWNEFREGKWAAPVLGAFRRSSATRHKFLEGFGETGEVGNNFCQVSGNLGDPQNMFADFLVSRKVGKDYRQVAGLLANPPEMFLRNADSAKTLQKLVPPFPEVRKRSKNVGPILVFPTNSPWPKSNFGRPEKFQTTKWEEIRRSHKHAAPCV